MSIESTLVVGYFLDSTTLTEIARIKAGFAGSLLKAEPDAKFVDYYPIPHGGDLKLTQDAFGHMLQAIPLASAIEQLRNGPETELGPLALEILNLVSQTRKDAARLVVVSYQH